VQGKETVKREDREIWEDLDDDERLEAYASVIEDRDVLRRPVAAVYDRFKHLDRIFEMVGDSDGAENTDPFHMAARDLWRAIKASLGHTANAGIEFPERSGGKLQ
jgi:hypothetical protein